MLSRSIIKLFYALIIAYLISYCHITKANNAYDARFEPKFENGLLYLNINLDPDYTIYSSHAEHDAFPTIINLDQSINLREYKVLWPIPYKEYMSIGGFRYVYSTNVSIPIEIKPLDYDKPVIIKGIIKYAICNNMCVPVEQDIEFVVENILVQNESFLWVLYAAVLGGLILNFMPCVLPVLFLKIFNIVQNQYHGYRLQLLATIVGIFTIFMLLGYATFWLKSIVMVFGIGGNFQQPEFIIILCLLMTLFTSNLLGRTEIAVPDYISSKLTNARSTSIYLNSFMSGIIAAIFSTPCTAPFLGSAISFAMTAEFPEIMQIFASIALGFSSPYILLIITPGLSKILPKPGPWMIYFKNILAVGMILTIFWLISVLYSQIGTRASAGTALLLLLIKFIFEQQQIIKWKKGALLMLLIAGLIYLPGMATKQDHQEMLAEELLWKKFSVSAVDDALRDHRVVVVDITANWCVTCKYNKFFLWDRSRTVRLLSNPRILALRGDVTNPSEIIQNYVQSFGVYGIPFNVVYGPLAPGGIILPVMPNYKELQDILQTAGL
jgi:suppressor for copper-sensitivity B